MNPETRVEKLLDALMRQDRNAGPGTLYDWWTDGNIDADDLRGVLLHVWGMAEFPARQLDWHVWQEWFEEAGFLSDDGSAPPASPVRVWRGCLLEYGPVGASWSTNRETARWFAEREAQLFRRGPAGVWELDAVPAGVLATHFARDDEQEVIIDPDYVYGALLVETIPVPREGFGA